MATELRMEEVDEKSPAVDEEGHKSDSDSDTAAVIVEYRTYKYRWIILALFVLYCICNAMQWIQYSIIANIIVKYYSVEYLAVDWTSMIYMLVYIPCIFPATWLLNKHGLRLSITLGSAGNCLGAWIKVLSVAPDRFWVTFIGQTIVAISQVFVLSVSVPLAAIWFGKNQVSTACAIGVLGLQMGNTLGFFIPPLMVKDHNDSEKIGEDLSFMFYTVAITSTLFLVLTVIFMRSKPPTPPSAAQAKRGGPESDESPLDFFRSLWQLIKNPSFLLLFISFGNSIGASCGIFTFLNQTVLQHYPGATEDAGNIGVVLVVGGMIGTGLFGYILDRTRKYKETMVVVYVLSTVATIAFTFVLRLGNIAVLYVIAAIAGFFLIGYIPVAFEYGVEITYPQSEATSAGVLMFGSQLFAVVFTMAYGWVFNPLGDLAANGLMSIALVLGSVLAAVIKSDLKRQRAEMSS